MTDSEDCVFSIDSSQRDKIKDPNCTSFRVQHKLLQQALMNENIQMHLKEFNCDSQSVPAAQPSLSTGRLHLFTKALPIPHNTSIQVYIKNQLYGTWTQLLRLCLPATVIKCKVLHSNPSTLSVPNSSTTYFAEKACAAITIQCCAEDQQHYLTADWIAHLQQHSNRPVLLYCGRIDQSTVCKVQLMQIVNSNQIVARLESPTDYSKLKRMSGASLYCYLYI